MYNKFKYALKQSIEQINRNKGMYVTSVLAITAMMLILGLFFVAFVNINLFTETIRQDYNVVQVYLNEDNNSDDNDSIENQLLHIEDVGTAQFISKSDAMDTLKERWGDNGYLLDNLDENPLPDSFMVYVDSPKAADIVAERAAEIEGVSDVTYYQDTINKLAKVTNFIELGSIIVMIFLIVVSVIIVANTIKLTVLNREKEITIMKYLGATDWFVRAPFLLGGIMIGILSSIIATVLIHLIYSRLMLTVGAEVVRIISVSLISTKVLIPNILTIFACLGMGIGTCGSIISIRRFLIK